MTMALPDQLAWFLAWLGRASLQASVLIVLILAARLLLRERLAPRWRHALWLLLVLRLLLPWSPPSRLSVYNLFTALPGRMSPAAPPVVEHASPIARPAMAVPALVSPAAVAPSAGGIAFEAPAQEQVMMFDAAPSAPPEDFAAPAVEAAAPAARSWAWLGWVALAAAWLVGCLALLGVAVAQSLALGAAVRTRRPVTDQRTLELLETCKATLGVRAWLAVVEAPGLASPALLGFVRPRLLLPQGAMGELGPDRLRHIFMHELAHLKRRDILMNWVLTALQAVHWFNPLVWLAFRRMREDRELACDALVLSHLGRGEASEYGRTIITLLERFAEPRRLAGLAGILEDKKQIKRRLTMIARFHRPSSLWSAVAALLMLGLGGAALTSAQPGERPDEKNAVRHEEKIIIHQDAPPGAGVAHQAAPGARLQIMDFKLEPYPEGGLYSPIISLKNAGDEPTPKYRVKFYRNQAERENQSYNNAGPIEPGGTWNEMTGPIALKEGENQIKVEVTPEAGAAAGTERAVHEAEMTVTIKNGAIVSKRVEIRSSSSKGADRSAGGYGAIFKREGGKTSAWPAPPPEFGKIELQLEKIKGLSGKLEPAMQEGLKRAAEAQQAMVAQAQKMMELAQRVTDEATRQAMQEQARQMQAMAQKQLDAIKAQLAQVQSEVQGQKAQALAKMRKAMEEQRRRMEESRGELMKGREALDAKMQKAMAELERARAEAGARSSGFKGIPGPRLSIRELRVEPDPASGQYRLTIRIANEGRETAAPFRVYLARNADAWRAEGGKIEALQDYWGGVGPLAPGEEKALEPSTFKLPDGERRIAVLVDPEGAAKEGASMKHEAELAVTVEHGKIVSQRLSIRNTSEAPGGKGAGVAHSFSYETRSESGSQQAEPAKSGIDLAVKELKAAPYSEGHGLFTLVATLANEGAAASPEFDLVFYRNDPQHEKPMRCHSKALQPGEKTGNGSMPLALKEGENTVEVVLDPDHKVPDANPANDRVAIKVTVQNEKITATVPVNP